MSAPRKDWIQSRRGLKVDLLFPDPDMVRIQDISHALSNLCRYTGHTSRFYSVAEHSIHVMRRAVQRFDAYRGSRMLEASRMRAAERNRVARWALLHDATEAYLGDVSRPLKRLQGMEGYRFIERKWERVIRERFGLEGPPPPEVEAADKELLGTEAIQLMAPVHPDWGASCPDGVLPRPIYGHPRMAIAPWFFGHWRARRAFMREFNRVFVKEVAQYGKAASVA